MCRKPKYKNITKIFRNLLMVFLCLFIIFPKHAYARRSAGGGDLAEFDAGKYVGNLAIGVATAAVGSVAGSAISSALNGTLSSFSLSNAFTQSLQFGNMLQGFNTVAATSQVGRAVSAYGTYNDWSPSTTFLVSNIATSVVGAGLNPEIALSQPLEGTAAAAAPLATPVNPIGISAIGKGVFVGALEGTAKGVTIYAIDKKRIDKGKAPSALGQIAGMATGMVATNAGRELMIHSPNTVGVYEYDAKDQSYQEIASTDKNTFKTETGETIGVQDFTAKYGDSSKYYVDNSSVSGVTKVMEIHPERAHLFRAAVVETFDNWPTLVSKGAGIAASQSLGEKKAYLAPLVGGLTEAITNPILQNMADVYGIKPSLYKGGQAYVTANRLAYKDMVGKAGLNAGMSPVIQRIRDIEDKNKNASPQELAAIYAKEFPELNLNPAEFAFKANDFDDDRLIKLSGKTKQEFDNMTESQRTQLKQDVMTGLQGASPIDIVSNQVISEAASQMQARMKGVGSGSDISIGQSLAQANTSRGELFTSRAARGVRSGVVEATISGAVEGIFIKNTADATPQQKMLSSYAANMVTAGIRGAALHAGWHKSEGLWQNDFQQRIVSKPQAPDRSQFKDPNELKIAENEYQREMMNYNSTSYASQETRRDFLRDSGGRTIPTYRPVRVDIPEQKVVSKADGGERLYVIFEDERPALSKTVAASIADASLQATKGAFYFSRPSKPENVSAMEFVNYMDYLNSTSGQSVGNLVSSGFVNANISSASNNILDSAAAFKPVADSLGMTPIRAVTVRNSPKQTVAIQRMTYQPATFSTNTELQYPMTKYGDGRMSKAQSLYGGAKLFRYDPNAPVYTPQEKILMEETPAAKQELDSINEYQDALGDKSDIRITGWAQMYKVVDPVNPSRHELIKDKRIAEVQMPSKDSNSPGETVYVEVPVGEASFNSGKVMTVVREQINTYKALSQPNNQMPQSNNTLNGQINQNNNVQSGNINVQSEVR